MQTQLKLSRSFAAGLLAIGAAFLVSLNAAQATPPPGFRTATGDFNHVISDEYTTLGTFHGITIQREDLVFEYAGDITGIATDVNFLFEHLDGSFESFATETCVNCTIGGRTGTFTAEYHIIGNSFTDYTGYLVFTGGTGGLSGLRGYGTFGYDGTTTFYTYYYRFGR